MGHTKIYSGSQVNAMAVKNALEQEQIDFIERNDIESAQMAGFGSLSMAVHLFVSDDQVDKAKHIVMDLKLDH
ncbi:MAG: DUF2007 domain-containing protein [Flavobacterium sp.]|nr:DUF2007 domain-containing protein [Candidatus Neoflavobacterium equi]